MKTTLDQTWWEVWGSGETKGHHPGVGLVVQRTLSEEDLAPTGQIPAGLQSPRRSLMIEVWELPVVHTSGLHLHLDYPLFVLPLLLSSLSVRLDVFFQLLLNFWWSWCYQNSKLIAVLNLQINTYLHHRYEKPIQSLTLALDLRTCSISSCWSALVVIFTFHSGPHRKFPLSPSHSEMTVSWGKILTQWNRICVKIFP